MPDLNNEKEYAHVCEISISLDKLSHCMFEPMGWKIS